MLTHNSEFRAFNFRPPQWRPREQLDTQTGTLLFITLLWLASLVMLSAHIFAVRSWMPHQLLFAAALIVFGAGIWFGWRRLVVRWNRCIAYSDWPALSRRRLYRLSPAEFEAYVAQRLFSRHGYRVQNTPESRDGGVDLFVEDTEGRRAVVQCKRHRGTVGAAAVRDLYGTVVHNDVDMGYLISTGKISDAARAWAQGKPIILIDGDRLLRHSRAEPEAVRDFTQK